MGSLFALKRSLIMFEQESVLVSEAFGIKGVNMQVTGYKGWPPSSGLRA
jgi:hypothetical protein